MISFAAYEAMVEQNANKDSRIAQLEEELTLIRERDSAAQREFAGWWDQSSTAAQDRKALLGVTDSLKVQLKTEQNEVKAMARWMAEASLVFKRIIEESEGWYEARQMALAFVGSPASGGADGGSQNDGGTEHG
jgi:hypothetical protein